MTDILQEKRNVLIEAYTLAKKAEDVLRYSYGKIDPSQLGVSKDPDFLETQEAMAARFARLEDILIKKVFRAIAGVEFVDIQRFLDLLNLMEKLRIIDSAVQWIEMKELRNIIVHEYEFDDLLALYRKVYQFTPVLFYALEQVKSYLDKP